jgi:hypothetical protein
MNKAKNETGRNTTETTRIALPQAAAAKSPHSNTQKMRPEQTIIYIPAASGETNKSNI